MKNSEKESNKTCYKICRWIKEKGGIPNQKSNDPKERHMTMWLIHKRQAKYGKGTYTFFSSDQAIAESYGLKDIFKTKEEKSNEICIKACKWIQKHNGKTPSRKSTDTEEKFLTGWIGHKRQARFNNSLFYSSDLTIIESYDLENIFQVKDRMNKKFKLNWKNSIASQLLLPEIKDIKLQLGKSKGFLASIAYLAYRRKELYLLDDLFTKWEIEQKGTPHFKGQLKENWLMQQKIEDNITNSNRTLSAISELVVANYLEMDHKILNLAAWNNAEDIICKKNGQIKHFEIKFFPLPPEIKKLDIESAKNGCAVGWVPNHFCSLNYFYFRIVEAIKQLEKEKCPISKRCVFFVFENKHEYDLFIESLNKLFLWYEENGEYPGILNRNVLEDTPNEWLKKINALYIGRMGKWKIISSRIKHFQK